MIKDQDTKQTTQRQTRPRPTLYPWRAQIGLDADSGAEIDHLATVYGGRGVALREILVAGLPIVRERIRKRAERAAKNN